MDIFLTKVFTENLDAYLNQSKRIIINQGGTSSSKTWSILQLLYEIAESSKTPRLISVVSETMPHLQKGCIRDFMKILGESYDENKHNKTNNIYTIGVSQIEFFAVDDPGKSRGPRRDILFINECNNVKKEIFEQLEIRTAEKIFLDFNPVAKFWAHDLIERNDVAFIKSTYLDNDRLDDRIKVSIEMRRESNHNWWRVYGQGEIGSLEGLIYPSFEIIESMPESFDAERMGLDFGFNDPTALIRAGRRELDLYLDEVIYETGLTAKTLIQRFLDSGIDKSSSHILADNARPEMIEEIHQDGWFIQPCEKGKDSVNSGINLVKEYKLHVTKRSTNLIKELRNYQWKVDKITGKSVDIPIDEFNHALDAVRYAVRDMKQPDILIRSL